MNISTFHARRLESLNRLSLKGVLLKKNPYLYRAKNLNTAESVVRAILDAHISSNEETIFGDWLEGLAIFVNQRVYGGRKSGIPNIDLEFDQCGVRYIVNIKSGPNWGNSSQQKKLASDFSAAARTLRTSGSSVQIVAVNGCCYGRTRTPDRGTYFKYCGQRFWEFISGDSEFYTKIIQPLGHRAEEANEEYSAKYGEVVNIFTRVFMDEYVDSFGKIDWEKIVRANSGSA